MSTVPSPVGFVNPVLVHHPFPGPSSPTNDVSSAQKRKRTDSTPDDSGHESAPQPRKTRDGPKKKKANRACFHCQKAHLTCDDSRPCQRCIKRGIASNCTEGHRKKAKYLLDEDELEQLKRSKTSASAPEGNQPSEQPAAVVASDSVSQTEPLLSGSFDPAFAFGSEAANLEYSILSAILGNPSPSESQTSPPSPDPVQSSYQPWPIDYPASSVLGSSYISSFNEQSLSVPNTPLSTPSNPTSYLTYPYTTKQSRSDDVTEIALPPVQEPQPQGPLHSLHPRFPIDLRPPSPLITNPDDPGSGLAPDFPNNKSLLVSEVDRTRHSCRSPLQSIHDRVTAPYDYTMGYHFLMEHLPSRFEKNDILRVVRALAIFRPSLIALQMPLSRDDEVFVEKCFQRSLLELEKLMSYSGTPTVVWRRTGEICLVAPEFCMLTEWPMEDLIGGKKYIYELFENQSVVEYWENFAAHAFENATRTVYSHCVLLKPSGAPVPATFCFSIRRDLFDLPSMVIGQWLPLL